MPIDIMIDMKTIEVKCAVTGINIVISIADLRPGEMDNSTFLVVASTFTV